MEAKNFTVKEIATEWKLSVDTVQRLFLLEPDVFVIQTAKSGKRSKKTLRVPVAVRDRVWRRNRRISLTSPLPSVPTLF